MNAGFKIKKCYGILFLCALLSPTASFAILIEDPSEWAKTLQVYEKMKEEISQLQKEYQMLTEQKQKLETLVNDAEGHYGYGAILNSAADLKNQEWSPNNWQSALQGLSGGNPERYQELLKAYQTNHPVMSKNDFLQGASATQASLYQQQNLVNQAIDVQATYSFNDIQQHLNMIHQLSEKIDQTQNTKAALDLNTRLIAELAYISTQELKIQTLVAKQQSEMNAERLAGEAETAKINALNE